MLQNSPEAMTSTTAVWTAMASISPPPTCCFALSVELRQLLKKYVALFLCMMSKSVPATTKKAITTTYACMTLGGTEAESSANGLLMTMVDACLEGPPRVRQALSSCATRRFNRLPPKLSASSRVSADPLHTRDRPD